MSELRNQLSEALAGRYEIDRELGRGGMATVFLARDLKHHRQVAVKVLNADLRAVLGVERFLSEIRVTANLQHPNLLPLFDSGDAAGQLFYVMPYVDGESLRSRLDREKQLTVAEVVRIATAVASALDYAHRQGVIHRDLKRENILLHDGQPIVADFGIALAVSKAGGQRVTQTGLSLGTPQYMSPEQATGDRTLDARSDIYALGAMTYEMLTGDPPHAGNRRYETIRCRASVTPDPPRDAVRGFGAEGHHARTVGRPYRRQVRSDRGATHPAWARNGAAIYYESGREIARAELEATPGGLRVRRREHVWSGNRSSERGDAQFTDYDVSPSGELVLFGHATTGRSEVVVELNWSSNVRPR
jgi:serine/threonine protein kinase